MVKVKEIFKMEKQEMLKCPICFEEYTDLKLKKCIHCNSALEKKIKYRVPNKTKGIILLCVFSIILLITIIFQIIQYNADLQECYTAIKEDYWYKFNEIIDKHFILKSDFEKKAYSKLYQAMDEKIEEIKKGNYNSKDDEVFKWTGKISYYSSNDKYKIIREKEILAKAYITINISNTYIQEEKYISAYEELDGFIKVYDDEYPKQIQVVIDKQNEIKDKAIEQVIIKAQEGIEKQSYYYVINLLAPYKDLGNKTILDMYQTSVKENNAKEQAEKQAKIEKEKFDFEVYCYFNMIAWKEKDTITDEKAYSKCANKFGISIEQAKESYNKVESTSWEYQSKYPDIYEKYASQYYR